MAPTPPITLDDVLRAMDLIRNQPMRVAPVYLTRPSYHTLTAGERAATIWRMYMTAPVLPLKVTDFGSAT